MIETTIRDFCFAAGCAAAVCDGLGYRKARDRLLKLAARRTAFALDGFDMVSGWLAAMR